MAEKLEVGMRLHAMFSDGEFYPASVVAISESKNRAKAPVKVHFAGYEDADDAWMPIAKLKSKRLPAQPAPKAAAKATAKATAKTKASAPKEKVYDYSGLTPGMKVQAAVDGTYYSAEVVTVSKKKTPPVKVHFIGYTSASDEWVGGDSLRSKSLKTKAPPKEKQWDYSVLTRGLKLQAEEGGKFFGAEVVSVSNKKGNETPVKIHWVGYTNASDVWVGGDRLKYKLLKKTDGSASPKKFTMPPAAKKLLLVKPKISAPLDPDFAPVILGKRAYLEAAKDCTDFLEWALPRAEGCGRYKLPVFADGSKEARASSYLAGVLIQEMIWQRSAKELLLCGPPRLTKAVANMFKVGGQYEFEIKSMPNVNGTPKESFPVKIVESASDLPAAGETPQTMGKAANGCRLAFDLGKSDIKTVAVKDGEVLYSKETEWDVTNEDPDYHFDAILKEMKLAAEKLPKVEAIGGSATGTVSSSNEATWCDIFPNVPPPVYKAKVVDIFQRLAKAVAGDVPLKVINDGEVTALAAVQKIKSGNVMGISMGSSEGGGYANADGNLLGWINELCYIRLDLNPKAPTDPWTKGAHTGISHLYLGQRGATKLAAKGGVDVPDNYKFPHKDMCTIKHETHAQCLKLIQKAMTDPEKEPKVRQIYETVGVYLGYALGQYCEFYKIDHVMILGRVSKGAGGDIMLDTAKKVLTEEFPEYAGIRFHTADDHFKAVGQCIAAAALPCL